MTYSKILAVTLLFLSLDSCALPQSSAIQNGSSATKWEYMFDRITYGVDCATEAFAPYKDNKNVVTAANLLHPKGIPGSGGHMDIASLWSLGGRGFFDGENIQDSIVSAIISSYDACGIKALGNQTNTTGDQGWEMVSFKDLTYLQSGNEIRSGLEIGYGYEVMWKRPKK